MVDDLLLPLAEACPERCNLFGLLGNFQRCLQCGSDKFPNKLRHFPLINIRVTANIPLLTSSALAFSVAASSALRIVLASPPLSALSIGTRVFCTGTRSSHYTLHSEPTYPASGHPTSVAGWRMRSVLLCHCQGNSRFGYRLPICFPLSRGWKRS